MADYSITGDTRLDASGFNKGLSAMSVAAGNLISGMVKSATGKIAELTTASVGVGMKFEASMSQVAATMGTSVDQIQNLTDKAKEMGSTTQFTATQAADALNYLALAGYDADKAAEVLPSVLNLAAAGGMDLAYASDLVTDAMASLNIEATKENVDDFGNKLAMGASKANASVTELGEAILTVGGTAANLKGGTTELITALGKLADVGMKGTVGGTHLRNIILSLQSPTDDAAKLMSKLGLEVYDAQGDMRGLDEILGDLNASMQGMTQSQRDSIKNALFNKTDLSAVNGLLAAQGEQWDALYENIDSAGGAMEQMAETQMNNLQGAVTTMNSALEGLQLAFYEYLKPTLTQAAQWGAECLSTLTTSLSEGGPEAMLKAAGEIITDLASGVAAKLPGLATSGVEIISRLAEDVVAATPQMLSSAAEILGALIQGLHNALPQLVSTGVEMVKQLGSGLTEGIPQLLEKALPIVANLASGLRSNVGQLVDAGIDFMLNLAQGIADGLPTLIEQLPGIVSDIAGVINDNAPKILAAGVEIIATLLRGIVQSIPTLIENIPQICKAIFDVFTAFRWVDIGKQIINGLWNGITSGWNALLTKVKSLVDLLPDIAKKALGIHSPSKVFSEIGMQTCAGLAQGLTDNKTKVKDAAKTVVASVTDTATEITDGVTKITETLTQVMLDGSEQQSQVITETSQQVVDGVNKTVKKVTTIAADGQTTVTQTMEDVKATVVSTTKDTQSSVVDGVQTTVETTTQKLSDGSEQVKTITTTTGKELIDGVERTVKTVTTKAADGTETVEKTIEDAGNTIVSTVKDTQTSLVDGIETTVEKTTKTLADGSEQVESVTTATGKEIIDGVERTVKTVTTKAADGTETVVKTIEDSGVQFASAGEAVVHQLDSALNDAWDDINNSIQSDVIGSIETLTKAISDGDLESLAKWTAGIFYGSLNDEQKKQINAFALDALTQLTDSLTGVCSNLVSLASNFIGQFVPAAGAAATAQGVLNTVMDANPVLAVISVIGLLVGALTNLAKNNKNVANGMKAVWSGVQDFLSVIFEGLLRAVALQIQGFVSLINGLIDTYNVVAKVWGGQIDHISNPASDYADKLKAEREQRAKDRQAQAAADKQQAELDAKYAKESADAEQKQLEAKYAKKQADLEKAKLSSDSPGMLAAEQAVAKASYEQSLADLDKKLLDAAYEKASAEIEKSTTTDATKRAELEKKITESDSTLKMGDLERQLLEVEYQNSLKELENKYAKKTDTSSKNSSSTTTNSSSSSSDDTAKKLADMKAQYDQKLSDLKADYAAKQKELAAQYDQKLDRKDSQYQQKLDSTKASYDKQLERLKTEYDRKLASLEKELDKASTSDKTSTSAKSDSSATTPTLPDNTADKLTDAVTDNTEAILSTNKALAEMVRQANTLVLSDNMAVSSRVAASGTARIAAAANNYTRQGDTNIVQNIYSKAQTAADLARETRWEADRAKAQKH